MMHGVVKRDGKIVGQYAIDPTAPGGMQAQVARIAAQQQQQQRAQMPSPPPSPIPLPGKPSPAAAGLMLRVPMPNVAPAQVFLRFPLRLPDGRVQHVTRAVQIDPTMGVPPGIYQLTGR